ncbi:MAG: hypothetical protein ACLRMJ_04365 [Alistipes finegoldii]
MIVTDQADNALDVEFPWLREGKVYTVAVSDYVYKNYNDLNYTDGKITEEDVTGLLLEELEEDSPLRDRHAAAAGAAEVGLVTDGLRPTESGL